MVASADKATLKGYDSFEVRLGDELRGERATLGKSLLDVQRDLRIKAAYIAAIENCDTSAFQNKGFVAGYVRSYARYLNLDADVVFARFSAESNFGGVNAGMNPKPKGDKHAKHARPAPGHSLRKETNTLIHPALRNPAMRAGAFDGISASGLSSVAVLLALIAGLGFGAWSILQDIQRVQLVPVDQTPGASATVVTPELPEMADSDLQGPVTPGGGQSDLLYARVYRPQELDVPVLDNRDGPIASIDPDAREASPLAAQSEEIQIDSLIELAVSEQAGPREPQLVVNAGPSQVLVFATNPAWIRVYLADGSRVFEKILETGEAYVLPADIQAPLLRAGNSGSVYLAVDNVAYGPIGEGTSIAKDIPLELATVLGSWPVAAGQAQMAIDSVAAATELAPVPVAAIEPALAAESGIAVSSSD